MPFDRTTRISVGSGKLGIERLEHRREHRNDEDQHRGDGDERDDQDDDRVGHGGLDLAVELDLGLVVDRDGLERALEESTDLTRANQVEHQRREDVGLFRDRVGERHADLDVERTSAKAFASVLFSVCSEMICSVRSSERPAAIMVAIWRLATARSLVLTRFWNPRFEVTVETRSVRRLPRSRRARGPSCACVRRRRTRSNPRACP